MIALGEAPAATIRQHGLRTYPEECCGALLGRFVEGLAAVELAWPIVNVREDTRRRRFLVDPRDYLTVEREAARRGLEVLGFVRSNQKFLQLPVLVLTTRDDEASRKAAMQAGATAYLTKPFTPHALLQEVRNLLGRAVEGTR